MEVNTADRCGSPADENPQFESQKFKSDVGALLPPVNRSGSEQISRVTPGGSNPDSTAG